MSAQEFEENCFGRSFVTEIPPFFEPVKLKEPHLGKMSDVPCLFGF